MAKKLGKHSLLSTTNDKAEYEPSSDGNFFWPTSNRVLRDVSFKESAIEFYRLTLLETKIIASLHKKPTQNNKEYVSLFKTVFIIKRIKK